MSVKGRRRGVILALTTFLLVSAATPHAGAAQGTTSLVSFGNTNVPSNGQSSFPAISDSGRFVAFDSHACNLLGPVTRPFPSTGIPLRFCSVDDTNADGLQFSDIFVRDRDSDGNGTFDEPGGTSTERVSVSSSGAEPNDGSTQPGISSASGPNEGRYVVFSSVATNLVPNDTNSAEDVFVHDRGTGETQRVSVRLDGSESEAGKRSFDAAISPDGSVIAFTSEARLISIDQNGHTDVYYRDRDLNDNGFFDEPGDVLVGRASIPSGNTLEEADGASWEPAVSEFGKRIAFTSCAENLVPLSQDGNGKCDVFVRRRDNSRTEIVSIGAQGSGNAHSGRPPFRTGFAPDGCVPIPPPPECINERRNCPPPIHRECPRDDVRYVSIAPNGDFISFASFAYDLVMREPTGQALFVEDLRIDTNDFTDIYVRDLLRAATQLVSIGTDGTAGNGASVSPVTSRRRLPDLPVPPPSGVGSTQITMASVSIAFSSTASNLVQDVSGGLLNEIGDELVSGEVDSNGAEDVFVRELAGQTTSRASVDSQGREANFQSWQPGISGDGRHVVFSSLATNLRVGDNNNATDVFVRDRMLCETGVAEEGTVSSRVHHDVEPLAGPAQSTAHALNCRAEILLGDLW